MFEVTLAPGEAIDIEHDQLHEMPMFLVVSIQEIMWNSCSMLGAPYLKVEQPGWQPLCLRLRRWIRLIHYASG